MLDFCVRIGIREGAEDEEKSFHGDSGRLRFSTSRERDPGGGDYPQAGYLGTDVLPLEKEVCWDGRGGAAGLLEDPIALLDLPSFKPGSQLLDVVGSEIGEEDDVDRVEELEDLLHPPGFLVHGGRLCIPGPGEVLQGELVDGDVLLLGLGQEVVLDIPGLFEGETMLGSLKRSLDPLPLDPNVQPVAAAVSLSHFMGMFSALL